MKKLFTLLLAVGTMTAVFAQGHGRDYQNNVYRNDSRGYYPQSNVYNNSNDHFNNRYVVSRPPGHNQNYGYYNVPVRRQPVLNITIGGNRNRGFNEHRRW